MGTFIVAALAFAAVVLGLVTAVLGLVSQQRAKVTADKVHRPWQLLTGGRRRPPVRGQLQVAPPAHLRDVVCAVHSGMTAASGP